MKNSKQMMLLAFVTLGLMMSVHAYAHTTIFVKCFAYGDAKENYFLAINPQTQTLVYNFQVKDPTGLNGLGEGERYQTVMNESNGPIHLTYDPQMDSGIIEVKQIGEIPMTIVLSYQTGKIGRVKGFRFMSLESITGWNVRKSYCTVKGLHGLTN